MSVMTAAERQIVQEALDSARFGFTTYAQAYLALQQILTDPLGPMGHRAGVSNSTFLFLGAAANVNAGIGIMASLGHAYSLEQLLLRTGSSQISQAMAQDVKATSDAIAQNVIESILIADAANNPLPTIHQIAQIDAAEAVSGMFLGDLGAWAGNPFFILFGHDQSFSQNVIARDGTYDAFALFKSVTVALDHPLGYGVNFFLKILDQYDYASKNDIGSAATLAMAVNAFTALTGKLSAEYGSHWGIYSAFDTSALVVGSPNDDKALVTPSGLGPGIVQAGKGNDTISTSGTGALIDGGDDSDTVDYDDAGFPIEVSFSRASAGPDFIATVKIGDEFDYLYNVEKIIGTPEQNKIIARDFGNVLQAQTVFDLAGGHDILDLRNSGKSWYINLQNLQNQWANEFGATSYLKIKNVEGVWGDTLKDFIIPTSRTGPVRGADPLVLDLNGNGIELSSLRFNSPYFNIDGGSRKEQLGWVTGGDGLLARDLNGNGLIDNVTELFGRNDTSGLADLATYDTNTDGTIDAADTNFASLRVWVDANENGLTEAGELKTLAQLGIQSISLTSREPTAAEEVIAGNEVHAIGSFLLTGGVTRTLADVAFLYDDGMTIPDPTYPGDPNDPANPDSPGNTDDPNIPAELDGGGGEDTVDYSTFEQALTITAPATGAQAVAGTVKVDTGIVKHDLTNIEILLASPLSDEFTGDVARAPTSSTTLINGQGGAAAAAANGTLGDRLDFSAATSGILLGRSGDSAAPSVEQYGGVEFGTTLGQWIWNAFVPSTSTPGAGFTDATGLRFTDFEHVIGSAQDDVLALKALNPNGVMTAAEQANLDAAKSIAVSFSSGNPATIAAAIAARAAAAGVIDNEAQDVVIEGGGGDLIFGTATGTNRIYGGADNDQISAGDFQSTVYGGAGTDYVVGGGGFQSVLYGDGPDAAGGATGSSAPDIFGLVNGATAMDMGTDDYVTWGGFRLTGGVQQWWQEGRSDMVGWS